MNASESRPEPHPASRMRPPALIFTQEGSVQIAHVHTAGILAELTGVSVVVSGCRCRVVRRRLQVIGGRLRSCNSSIIRLRSGLINKLLSSVGLPLLLPARLGHETAAPIHTARCASAACGYVQTAFEEIVLSPS